MQSVVIIYHHIEYYRDVTSMQLKLIRILKIKRSRFDTISKLWDEEVKTFFPTKSKYMQNSKYFKMLSIPIETKK